jgi:hypothetical protein
MGSREVVMELLTFPFQAHYYDRPAREANEYYGIAARPAGIDVYGPSFEVLPEGWMMLGMGISRVAFRGPDGFVYKIPHYVLDEFSTKGTPGHWGLGFRHTNFGEAMTYAVFGEKIASENPGYRLAASEYLYDLDIQVMEFVEKCPAGKYATLLDIQVFEKYGISDLHGENVYKTGCGEVVVIDYAASNYADA